MRPSIWKRHFFTQIASIVLLFLALSWALFILIDFTNRGSTFQAQFSSIQEIGYYYLFLFLQKIEILLPFALLIGSIKTLLSLNTHNELIALLAAGLSLRSLMQPFIIFALLMTAGTYINFEWGLPYAMTRLHQIEDSHFQKNAHEQPAIQQLLLEDGSLLVFHHFNTAENVFPEAYWVHSIDSIYRLRHLFPYAALPYADEIDHFVRQDEGKLVLAHHSDRQYIENIYIHPEDLLQQVADPRELPLSKLFEMQSSPKYTNERKALITTALLHKLTMPLLCLIVFLIPAPFCLKCTRTLNSFLIYVLSTFSLVTFYLILNALNTLSMYQVCPPELALLLPYAVLGILSFCHYLKLDTR